MIFPDDTIFPSKSITVIPSNGTTTEILSGGLSLAIILRLHVDEYLEALASREILQILSSNFPQRDSHFLQSLL